MSMPMSMPRGGKRQRIEDSGIEDTVVVRLPAPPTEEEIATWSFTPPPVHGPESIMGDQVKRYQAWRKQGAPHDVQCSVCSGMVNVMLHCHTCRRSYHERCLGQPVGYFFHRQKFFCQICIDRQWHQNAPPATTPPQSPQVPQVSQERPRVALPNHRPSMNPKARTNARANASQNRAIIDLSSISPSPPRPLSMAPAAPIVLPEQRPLATQAYVLSSQRSATPSPIPPSVPYPTPSSQGGPLAPNSQGGTPSQGGPPPQRAPLPQASPHPQRGPPFQGVPRSQGDSRPPSAFSTPMPKAAPLPPPPSPHGDSQHPLSTLVSQVSVLPLSALTCPPSVSRSIASPLSSPRNSAPGLPTISPEVNDAMRILVQELESLSSAKQKIVQLEGVIAQLRQDSKINENALILAQRQTVTENQRHQALVAENERLRLDVDQLTQLLNQERSRPDNGRFEAERWQREAETKGAELERLRDMLKSMVAS